MSSATNHLAVGESLKLEPQSADLNPNILSSSPVRPLTALCRAVLESDAEGVKHLLEAHAEVNVTNPEGQTALHLAAKTGQTQVVKLLLEAGAEVNLQDRERRTALHLAVLNKPGDDGEEQEGNSGNDEDKDESQNIADVVKVLVGGGADIETKDRDGHTPLDLMRMTGLREVVTGVTKMINDDRNAAIVLWLCRWEDNPTDLGFLKHLCESCNLKYSSSGQCRLSLYYVAWLAMFSSLSRWLLNWDIDEVNWWPFVSEDELMILRPYMVKYQWHCVFTPGCFIIFYLLIIC